MKKFKHIVPIILALVMTVGIALSGCKPAPEPEPEPEVTTSLQSIKLDTSSVKTDYLIGDQFSAEGLSVKAVLQKSDSDEPYEETLTSDKYTLDSSAFKANTVGKYSIKVSYTYEEVTKDATYDVTVTSVALSLDTSAVQALFLTTEEFNSDNLVVNRVLTTVDGSASTKLAASDYTLDSSKYKKEEGGYTISVSHNYSGKKLTAEYPVQVIEPRQGVSVSLKAEVEDTIVLSADKATADLSEAASWIEVKQPDSYGVVAEDAPVLDSSKYTVSVYNAKQKLETLTGLTGGAYQIWVEIPAETESGFALKGFVNIYVVDNLVSIALKNGATLTQTEGADKISSTWKFTATYATGATKDLTVADVKVEGLDTKTVAAEAKATVSYTDTNVKGEEVTKTTEVTYTITQKQTSTGTQEHSYKLSVGTADEATLSENKVWLAEDADGNSVVITATSGSTVAIDANKKSVDGTEYTHRIKLGGEGKVDARSIKITVTAKTEITVYAMSSSNKTADDPRALKLLNAEGTELDLTALATLDGTAFTADTKVDGANLHKIEITVEAGTYYFASKSGGLNVYGVNLEIEAVSGTPVVETKEYKLSVGTADEATLSENKVWLAEDADGNSVVITATSGSTVAIDANKKSADGTEYTHRIKLGGEGKVDARSIKITVTAKTKITVYAMSSSNKTADDPRALKLLNAEGTALDLTALATLDGTAFTADTKVDGANLHKIEITVEAGTYYFASKSGGLNVYGVNLEIGI